MSRKINFETTEKAVEPVLPLDSDQLVKLKQEVLNIISNGNKPTR